MNTVIHLAIVILPIILSASASRFDACHLKCDVVYSFALEKSCGKGCELAVENPETCPKQCEKEFSGEQLDACKGGCNHVKPKAEVIPRPMPQNLGYIINNIMNNMMAKTGPIIRFHWFVRETEDTEPINIQKIARITPMEIHRTEPTFTERVMRKINCIKNYKMAFPFMISLCFVLIACLVLMLITVIYRLRDFTRRRCMRTRRFERLPKYADLADVKYSENEAGPLPEKVPIEA